MKKIISLLGCCFIAISTLTACENNNLPAWADTDVLTPKAQTMIDTLNAFVENGPTSMMMTFQITLLPALIMLVLFLVLAFIVPVVALRLLNNRSVVERLRVNE